MKHRAHTWLAVAVMSMMTTLDTAVIAETAIDPVTAEGLFWEGRRAADASDWETACARFAESQRLEPATGTIINLADCEERRGRIATAWQLNNEALGQLGRHDERRRYIQAKVDELAPQLPRLTLQLRQSVAGVQVLRDGVELGKASLGIALPVDPGDHVIEVRAPGRKTVRHPIHLAAGETRVIEIVVGEPLAPKPKPPPPVVEPETPTTETPVQMIAGWSMIGVGGAALVASAILGGFAFDRWATVQDNCDDALRCNARGLAADADGDAIARGSTVMFTIGLSATLGGVVMLAWPNGGGPSHAAARFVTRF